MNYTLDSYANFDEEQELIATEAKKKDDLIKLREIEEREIEFRWRCIMGYFLRMSWWNKKKFIISFIQTMNGFDSLLRIIGYISTLFGKMAAYSNVTPEVRDVSEQIILDHNRGLEWDFLKETVCRDLQWLTTISPSQQILMIIALFDIAGPGLVRKSYLPIVNHYNNLLKNIGKNPNDDAEKDLMELVQRPPISDQEKYPQQHPLTIEVDRIRKKWSDTLKKHVQDVFKDTANAKKLKKTKKSKSTESVDWIQMLPIWIVKKIFNYLDQNTLKIIKKVNRYWAYASDSLLKDRQCRAQLNKMIEQFGTDDDLKVVEIAEYQVEKPKNPRIKRMKRLLERGATIKSLRPQVESSKLIQSSIITSAFCDPVEKVTTFPRLVKDDLLLYRHYDCNLKDVNILIDVQDTIRKERDTLSYSLSQQLSDTFSLSHATLADW